MIKLITYTDHRMTISAQRLAESALKMGANQADIYFPGSLSPDFQVKMKDVLSQERGAGWYCWKPHVIKLVAESVPDGDILIWSDAGTEIVQPLRHLVDAMDDVILLFSNGFRHIEWCKMDLIHYCFPSFGKEGRRTELAKQAEDLVMNAKQVQASHIVFKLNPQVRHFIAHWEDICMQPHLVDNSPSIEPNFSTFQEHRWDQSILTCLQIMYGYKLHWFPSVTGFHIKDQHPDDRYPAMFNHHRKRNDEWKPNIVNLLL